MKNAKTYILLFALIISVSVVSAQPCPSDDEFLDLLQRAIIYCFAFTEQTDLSLEEMKDVINFYLSTEDTATADCGTIGQYSGESINEILFKIKLITAIINKPCEGGVLDSTCSATKPLYCVNSIFVDNCTFCGCDEDLACVSDSCVAAIWENCSDCGSGLFNTCDREECSATSELCYFIGSLISGSCYSCSEILSCGDYSNDIETCNNDPCKLARCAWNGTCMDCDFDKDNYSAVVCGGDDCDDLNVGVHPNVLEVCENSIDDDCDGVVNEGCLCSQQSGYICEGGEVCPASDLNASDIDNCCSESCVVPSCDSCSDCGTGLFNVCDREECQSCNKICYFVPTLLTTGNCYLCSSIEGCNSYKDETSCNVNKCNLKNCKWVSNSCMNCDFDNDGYLNKICSGDDCDDTNININPGVLEVCDNGLDDDCNGLDSSCSPDSCSDGTVYGQCATVNPLYCNNGVLVKNCELCGCPGGQTCQEGGRCESSGNVCNIFSGEKATLTFDIEQENRICLKILKSSSFRRATISITGLEYLNQFPTNPSLEVGYIDGQYEWTWWGDEMFKKNNYLTSGLGVPNVMNRGGVADLDNDGDLDVIQMARYNSICGSEHANLIGFENIGSDSGYESKFLNNDNLVKGINKDDFSYSSYGIPCDWLGNPVVLCDFFGTDFADLDADGDYDLFIGNHPYRNAGTVNLPSWVKDNSLASGLPSKITGISFADLDGDRDYDAIVGGLGYENVGLINKPSWKPKPDWNVLNVPWDYFPMPTLGDLDADGDYDLIITAVRGGAPYVKAYENTGNRFIPTFELKSEWSLNPAGVTMWWCPAPLLGDFNRDGNLDLVVLLNGGVGYQVEGSGDGTFRLTKTTEDFSEEVNQYLSECIPDMNNHCFIPLIFHSDSVGVLGVSNLNTVQT